MLFFNIVSIYFNTLFNRYINLTIDGTIYPSQHFPIGAAFVCQAGNFWTLLRTCTCEWNYWILIKVCPLPQFSTLYIGTVGSSKELHPSNKPHYATSHDEVIDLHKHHHENLKPQVHSVIIEMIIYYCINHHLPYNVILFLFYFL